MRLWIADTIAILLLPVVIATISLASFYNGRVHGEKEAAIRMMQSADADRAHLQLKLDRCRKAKQ